MKKGTRIAALLWKGKIFFSTVVLGVFICVSLYTYEKPKPKKPDTVIAANTQESQKNDSDTDNIEKRSSAAAIQGNNPGTVGSVEENKTYKDGTYTGSAQGFGGTIKVEVRINNGKIKSIKVLSANGETPSYFNKAKMLLQTIIKKQSTNVDAISGATYSSNGIIKAVRSALSKAVDNDSATESEKKESSVTASGKFLYPDGVYYGTGEGYAGEITVAIIIRNHTLMSAVITKTVDGDSYVARAERVLDEVVKKQSAKVDVVSGATYSSKGIIEAIKNALKAAASGKSGLEDSDNTNNDPGSGDTSTELPGDTEDGTIYKNGTYTGSAACVDDEDEAFDYMIDVEIGVGNDRITSVTVVDKSEDNDWKNNLFYINKAKKGVVSQIIAKGKPEEIDAVSGATYSSNAIVMACQFALEKAKK